MTRNSPVFEEGRREWREKEEKRTQANPSTNNLPIIAGQIHDNGIQRYTGSGRGEWEN